MENSDREDSLGFDQTLFPTPSASEKGSPQRPPIGAPPLDRSLGNLNTLDGLAGASEPAMTDPQATAFFNGIALSGLSEGLSLGGNYRLDQRLGRGGMGEAWKASDLMAGRNVVIKLVPPEIRNAELAMSQVRDTFLKVHALQHQHICPIMGLIEDPNFGVYLVMKFISGKTLDVYRRDYIAEHGRFPTTEAIQLLWAVARALDYSHERKVLHRDVKPQNIMISPEDGVQLIDFGLAAEIRSSMMQVSETPMDMAGTRPYMAPEQWRGRLQDAQTDQYALAVTAYELIAGHLPFQTQDATVLRECVLNEEPEPIPGVADHINAAIRKAMSKRREDRFENCRTFVKAMATRPKEAEKTPAATLPTLPPEPSSPPIALPQVEIVETKKVRSPSGSTVMQKTRAFLIDSFSPRNLSLFWMALGSLSAVSLFLIGWALFESAKPAPPRPAPPVAVASDNEVELDVPASVSAPAVIAPASIADNATRNAPDGFHSLFDGRSFREHWRPKNGQWTILGDILSCRDNGNLLSVKEYENFVFRFDFRISAGTNNGVLVRVPDDGNYVNGGFEVQILDNFAPEGRSLPANKLHGSIYGVEAARQGALKPAGQWNSQEIHVNGKEVRVTLNGEDILSTNIQKYNTQINKPKGYIGFAHMKGTIELRNIEIRELPGGSNVSSTVSGEVPRVVSTYPVAGANGVHTSLREISVTFDRDMDRNGMDWGTAFYDCPPAAPFAKPYWQSDRTCVLPIQALSPRTDYRIRLNNSNACGFHGKNGKRLEAFEFRFRTDSSPNASTASSSTKTTVAYGTNIVPNPSFESGTLPNVDFWEKAANVGDVMLQSSTDAYEGRRSVMIECNDPNGGMGVWRQDGIPCEPNTKYRFSVMYKMSDVRPATHHPSGVQFCLNAHGPQNVGTEPFTGTKDWTKFEQEIITGNTTTVFLMLRLGYLRPDGWSRVHGRVWFDDVRIEKIR